jgi:hypothetical protein
MHNATTLKKVIAGALLAGSVAVTRVGLSIATA